MILSVHRNNYVKCLGFNAVLGFSLGALILASCQILNTGRDLGTIAFHQMFGISSESHESI